MLPLPSSYQGSRFYFHALYALMRKRVMAHSNSRRRSHYEARFVTAKCGRNSRQPKRVRVACLPVRSSGDCPVFVTEKPEGYREWKFISVAHEEGNLNSFASVLGNGIAISAYREGKLPFPDGAIIAPLHYRFVPSAENNKDFGRDQSFVAGAPTNVQFMIKDSKKYAATGGWGFGHFNNDGKPVDHAFMKTCFPCHQKIKDRDLVFTRYAS
jgi:Cytochrome P460